MRACFLPNLTVQESYTIDEDALHHLVHVIRIQVTDKLLLLNGRGLNVLTNVESISKKELRLKFENAETYQRPIEFDLALGMPKREALELSLKEAVELGFRKIYLIKSAYSQQRFLEADRVQNLLISALEQSNASYLPEVIESDWRSIPWESYGVSILMDSQTKRKGDGIGESFLAPRLLVVGPEGGFSPEEIEYLHARPKLSVLSLPTPILRTPTAVATGAGVVLQLLE